MEIYCIILSPQQKRRSASVSVCQAGPRKMPPLQADKAAGMAVYFRPAHSILHTPGGQRYDVPLCTSLHPFVLICACMCVCVCACVCGCMLPCLCLYIPPVNRVAGSCPWVSIDRECGICRVFLSISLCERAGGSFVGLQQGHTATTAARPLSVAALAKRQGLSARLHKDTACGESKGALLAKKWRRSFAKRNIQSVVGEWICGES